ncbi:hypothetical protein TorRG33x02_150410 [Trema orientale]|uniref:Uncharacterized protein n=1 Tax=Trema orientale TaxID=63057 RepID=A0A2P5EUF5_TREOI|nr:hypothetical protein TorRG33x02_150410 [Trema orientale]
MFSTDLLNRRVLPTTKGGRQKSLRPTLSGVQVELSRPIGFVSRRWSKRSRNYTYSILDTE